MDPLVDLLKRPEGKTIKFKRDFSSPDKALRSSWPLEAERVALWLSGFRSQSTRSWAGRVPVSSKSGSPTWSAAAASLIFAGDFPRSPAPKLRIRCSIPICALASVSAQATGPTQLVFGRIGSANWIADLAQFEELKRVVLRQILVKDSVGGTNPEAVEFRAILNKSRGRLRGTETAFLRTSRWGHRVLGERGYGRTACSANAATRAPRAWRTRPTSEVKPVRSLRQRHADPQGQPQRRGLTVDG